MSQEQWQKHIQGPVRLQITGRRGGEQWILLREVEPRTLYRPGRRPRTTVAAGTGIPGPSGGKENETGRNCGMGPGGDVESLSRAGVLRAIPGRSARG
jgi:hypothetical protein